MEEEITKQKVEEISFEMERQFPVLSLDVQIYLDRVFSLGFFDKELLVMFDLTNFINRDLVYILQEIAQSFSISTGFFIFPSITDIFIFIHNNLSFTLDV